MTFSIVAHCPRTGMLGVAVATAVPAVGAVCPYVKAGVGAVSTQSWVNPLLAIDALRLMEKGMPAPAALEAVIAQDGGRDVRQIGVIDAAGRIALACRLQPFHAPVSYTHLTLPTILLV